MTKADIAERFAERSGCTRKVAQDLVESLLGIMKATLETGEELKISGFGKFEVRQKHDRRGRNPQTGESLTITARRVLRFKPSKILCDSINKE